MKILYENKSPFFEMAKLTKKRADKNLCGDFGEFIYFTQDNSSHSPRIKFYGGTKETGITKTAPTLQFNAEGECELKLQPWMNKQNCPNAFDAEYVKKVENFVKKFLSLLLLTWFYKLDESDTLAYFQGNDSFSELLSNITNVNDEMKGIICKCRTCEELHELCLKNNLYEF